MGSVAGPMLLFFIPLILALSNYVTGWQSGWIVDWNHRWTFWVTYFAFVIWNTALIVYGLFMAPAIKIWYFTRGFNVDEIVAAHKQKIAREKYEEEMKAKKRAAQQQCLINPSLCGAMAEENRQRQEEYAEM